MFRVRFLSPHPFPLPGGEGELSTDSVARCARAYFREAGGLIRRQGLEAALDEVAEETAARQRIRMLIDKYDHLIKATPDAAALSAAFQAGEQEIAEIEAAGQKGKEAARALKRKLTDRMTRFNNKAA